MKQMANRAGFPPASVVMDARAAMVPNPKSYLTLAEQASSLHRLYWRHESPVLTSIRRRAYEWIYIQFRIIRVSTIGC